MLTAVGRSHLTGAGIQTTVGSTGGSGHSPARLPAVSGALAVLPACSYLGMENYIKEFN